MQNEIGCQLVMPLALGMVANWYIICPIVHVNTCATIYHNFDSDFFIIVNTVPVGSILDDLSSTAQV